MATSKAKVTHYLKKGILAAFHSHETLFGGADYIHFKSVRVRLFFHMGQLPFRVSHGAKCILLKKSLPTQIYLLLSESNQIPHNLCCRVCYQNQTVPLQLLQIPIHTPVTVVVFSRMSAYTHIPNTLGFEFFGSNRVLFSLRPRVSRCGLSRRDITFRGIVASGASVLMSTSTLPAAQPSSKPQGLEKLPFKPDGYNYWMWRDRKIHYVVEGKGFPIVLIHGFGASAFHWRYNIPELAKHYKVYALDLLGFGWSEKALIEYDALVWRDQVVDFLKDVVREPTVLVGNSLGGFTALVAAASQDQVKGVVLLNSAGQFGGANDAANKSDETVLQKVVLKPLKEVLQRVVLGFLFWQAKQPARIKSVLKSVYINSDNVDDYLIDSITRPAEDPNAGEVYYRLMTRFMSNQRKYSLDNVLSQLSCPLLLVWGDLDPWVGPAKALQIKEFYPNTSLVNLQAGHCPHDEVPELVNKALLEWLSTLTL